MTTTVINELTVLSGESAVALILDDYHLIDAPAVHTSVGFLLDRLPLGLRLVLTSRADPPLPLARLRGRGQLAELRAAGASRSPRQPRSCVRRLGWTCRRRRLRSCRTAPRAGRSVCSLLHCRCRATPTRRVSWSHSPAAIGMFWTI